MEAEATPLRERAGKADADAKAWATERSFLEVGLSDPEARDIAALLHGKIPEGDRPPLADWLRAVKADPAKAPRALAPYLGTATKAEAGPAPAAGTRPVTPPAPATKIETTPAAGVAVSAEAIRAAAKRGDWKTFDALRAQLDAEKGGARG
jgi:hypothetical protein